MKRNYPTIYPVLNLKQGKVIDIFDDVEKARSFIQQQMKESSTIGVNTLSVLLPETKGNLIAFTLGQLLDIYELILPVGERKRSFRKKHTAISAIMRYLNQRKTTPVTTPKGKPIKTPERKKETAPIRKKITGARPKVKPKVEKVKITAPPRKPQKKAEKLTPPRFRMRFKLSDPVHVTTVELATTGQSYRLDEETGYSARYLFHKYITKGYDKATVLRKVKHQTGEEQNPSYYQYYLNQVKKLGVLKVKSPDKYH